MNERVTFGGMDWNSNPIAGLFDAPTDGTPTVAQVALGSPIANEGAIPSGAAFSDATTGGDAK